MERKYRSMRYFRNNGKITLRSIAHAWAACVHGNLYFVMHTFVLHKLCFSPCSHILSSSKKSWKNFCCIRLLSFCDFGQKKHAEVLSTSALSYQWLCLSALFLFFLQTSTFFVRFRFFSRSHLRPCQLTSLCFSAAWCFFSTQTAIWI